MLVKCRCCGNKIDRNNAWKLPNSKPSKYYCCETEYLDQIQEKNDRDRVYLIINDIFERTVTNSILFKEMNAIFKVYGVSDTLKYLLDKHEEIKIAMDKVFSNEYAQIRYFSAIVNNSLTDYKRDVEQESKPIKRIEIDDSVEEVINVKYKNKKKRVGLSDLDI